MFRNKGEVVEAQFVMLEGEEEISKPACIARLYLTAMVVGALFLYGLDKYGIREEASGVLLQQPAHSTASNPSHTHLIGQLNKLADAMK